MFSMRRCLIVSLVCLAGTLVADVQSARAAGALKTAAVLVDGGPATGADNFLVKIVARDDACTAASIFELTQAYDAVAGGDFPTTREEIRDEISAGLTVAAPAGYTLMNFASPAGTPGIFIQADKTDGQHFDVCVDGVKILGAGVADSVMKDGITISGFGKAKTPLGACCLPPSNGNDCVEMDASLCSSLDGRYDGDGTACAPDGECIPTMSEWGVLVMLLLVLTAGTVVVMRRREGAIGV